MEGYSNDPISESLLAKILSVISQGAWDSLTQDQRNAIVEWEKIVNEVSQDDIDGLLYQAENNHEKFEKFSEALEVARAFDLQEEIKREIEGRIKENLKKKMTP